MEIGLAVQEETKRLQQSEQLLAKVAILETHIQVTNPKFRGLPEPPDLNANLVSSLASWLALVLKLEDGVAPTILSAYRLALFLQFALIFCET